MRKELGLLTLILASCGGGDTFESADAKKAAETVQNTISSAVSQAVAGQQLRRAEEDLDDVLTIENFEYECTGGGTATLNGTASGFSGVDENSANVDWDFEISFAACSEESLTLDGSLNYRLQFAFSGLDNLDPNDPSNYQNVSYEFDFLMEGTISYAGEITGECEYDVRAAASGTGNSPSAQPTVEGSICGVDVADLQAEGYNAFSFGG